MPAVLLRNVGRESIDNSLVGFHLQVEGLRRSGSSQKQLGAATQELSAGDSQTDRPPNSFLGAALAVSLMGWRMDLAGPFTSTCFLLEFLPLPRVLFPLPYSPKA